MSLRCVGPLLMIQLGSIHILKETFKSLCTLVVWVIVWLGDQFGLSAELPCGPFRSYQILLLASITFAGTDAS